MSRISPGPLAGWKLWRRVRILSAGVVVLAGAAACSESIDSTAGCPILCPSQQLAVREATLDAVEFDASVAPFPPMGAATFFVLAHSGDSVDARVVVRFDSLLTVYTVGGEQQTVTDVDSAHFRISIDTLNSRASAPFTIEVFDVDTAAADGDFDADLALFRPDRLLGSRTFQLSELKDTLSIPLINDLVSAKVQTSGRMRVGIRARSDATLRLVMFSANETRFPRVRYDPAPLDPEINVFDVAPRSRTPVEDPAIALDFTDYQVVVSGPFPLRPHTDGLDTAGVFRDSVLSVGGLGRRRTYLRFDIPDSILRSSIIRATLFLHKKPTSTYGLNDTLNVVPQAVFATSAVPVAKAALLTDTLFFLPIAPQRMAPDQGGERQFELANFARAWTTDTRDKIPIAMILRIGGEGRVMHEMLFYSTLGPEALRPRLRITFIPRQRLGTP